MLHFGYTFRVLTAVIATAPASAVPAAADKGDYLRMLQDRYVYLSMQQLLSEGTKACAATHTGTASPEAVNMVSRDLVVPVAVAGDVMSAAVVTLGR